jgi:hypothetical protein
MWMVSTNSSNILRMWRRRVIAVFLFHFAEKIKGTDEWLWVIEGDAPTAYLVLDRATNPLAALQIYCELMEAWADAVLKGGSLDGVFPVEAEATAENAVNLIKRIKFISNELIPELKSRNA